MTAIHKNDYIFLVDTEKTKEYYKNNSLCDCNCCRNFYAQIKEKFTKLDAFLTEFGIDIARPDEIMSVAADNYIDYINVDYTVCGRIKTMGEQEMNIYDNSALSIVITNGFASPNEQTEEYFTISITQIKLPWVLNEPFPKTITIKDTVISKCKNFFKQHNNKQ